VLIAECEQRLAEIDIEAIRAEGAAPRTARRLRAEAVRLWRELAELRQMHNRLQLRFLGAGGTMRR
jgi:hypothetical protein